MSRRRPPDKHDDIALERINILFGLADKEFERHPERSDRYVELARRISMRCNAPIPAGLKSQFCKECNRYLRPGRNCTVRANPKTKSVDRRCSVCGAVMRYPYHAGGR